MTSLTDIVGPLSCGCNWVKVHGASTCSATMLDSSVGPNMEIPVLISCGCGSHMFISALPEDEFTRCQAVHVGCGSYLYMWRLHSWALCVPRGYCLLRGTLPASCVHQSSAMDTRADEGMDMESESTKGKAHLEPRWVRMLSFIFTIGVE